MQAQPCQSLNEMVPDGRPRMLAICLDGQPILRTFVGVSTQRWIPGPRLQRWWLLSREARLGHGSLPEGWVRGLVASFDQLVKELYDVDSHLQVASSDGALMDMSTKWAQAIETHRMKARDRCPQCRK